MAYMNGYDRERLGFLPVIPLATTVASKVPVVGGIISGIGGLFSDSKDPGRLASNANAFADASNGDPSALTYLKARSGRFGTIAITPPWRGDPVSPLGGWATSKAKDDAYSRYQQLTNLSSSPVATSSTPVSTPGGLAQQLPDVVSHAGILPLLVIGGIGYMAYKSSKKRR